MAKKRNLQSEQMLSALKRIYVDKIVIWLQLALVAIVAVDYLFYDALIKDDPWVLALILVGSAIIALVPVVPTQKFLSLFLFGSIHVILAAFYIFVVPVGSPYELIYFLLLYFTTYWYGVSGYVASASAIVVISYLAFQQQIDSHSIQDTYLFILKTALFLIIGGVLTRLHDADIDERRELLKTMREASFERQRLQSLINSMADAVIATDFDGKILVYNGAALDLLNTNKTLENQPLRHFLKTYDAKTNKPLDLIALAKHAQTIIKRDDILYKINQNENLNLYISVAQIHISYGEHGQEGFILLLRDITKEKSIEEQRDEFISVVSHELRTPIAITEANISTAMLPDIIADKAKVADLLEQAHQNVIFLADMINDITTLAHAERGDLDAEIEDVDPAALIEDVAGTYEAEMKEMGLKLVKEVEPNLPHARSNNYRLKEILQDFMTNAIKYTDKGSVTLRAEKIESGVRFSVSDTGIGMSLSDQHHVFQKFWRSEDYRTRSHKGTGLGLYIAKKLAERMHATVGVSSKLNKGTTFYLEVPLELEGPREKS